MDPQPGVNGRPVYFVRPHSVLQEALLDQLIRHEYEVAVLEDHTKTGALLKQHPEAIVFLNIDEGYKPAEWEALVRLLLAGQGTNRIGIVTYNDSPELSRHYLLDLGVGAGFVKLSLGINESTATIHKALEANEAKGRRQFVRVACRGNTGSFNVKAKGVSFQGTLLELSSSAMAGSFFSDPQLPPRTLVPDLQLKLYGTLCTAPALALGSRALEDGTELRYFLFDPKTPDATRDRIRWFLRKTLQANLDDEMSRVKA